MSGTDKEQNMAVGWRFWTACIVDMGGAVSVHAQLPALIWPDLISGAAKHGEQRVPETAVDVFIPFKDDQDDTVAAGVVNRLINTLHMGKDVAQVIWNHGWFQFLECPLIQCQSILLALLGANEQS
jgi:hypothetical protein